MSELAAAVLAAGELICQFHDGYRRSLLADLVREPLRVEQLVVFENVGNDAAQAISSLSPGRKPVRVRMAGGRAHFIQEIGQSVRVTTLTRCERTKWRGGEQVCVRFAATQAWHFDTAAARDPEGVFARVPSGAAQGSCEPWRID